MTSCWRCGERSRKDHPTPEDCIQALQRRNARDRADIRTLAMSIDNMGREMSRLGQRVEMLAAYVGQGRDKRLVATEPFKDRRGARVG